MNYLHFFMVLMALCSLVYCFGVLPQGEKARWVYSFVFIYSWPECKGIDANTAARLIQGECSDCHIVVMNQVRVLSFLSNL